jgi:hypothetical protein
VTLSTVPSDAAQGGGEEGAGGAPAQTRGLFSWFPLFFPLRAPLPLEAGERITLALARRVSPLPLAESLDLALRELEGGGGGEAAREAARAGSVSAASGGGGGELALPRKRSRFEDGVNAREDAAHVTPPAPPAAPRHARVW